MARVNVYIEEGLTEGPPVAAWVLDLPGAYAAGQTREDALQTLAQEVRDYWAWLRKFGEGAPSENEPVEVEVVETFRAFKSSPDYEVNALFAPDARPVEEEEIPRYLRLLEMSRTELLEVLSRVPREAFEWKRDERTRTIREILRHVAQTEIWYLSRVLSVDSMTLLLEATRAIAKDYLSRLDVTQRGRVVTHAGEQWSARKGVRRFLWHERYHTKSIRRILETYQRAGGGAYQGTGGLKTSKGGSASDHA